MSLRRDWSAGGNERRRVRPALRVALALSVVIYIGPANVAPAVGDEAPQVRFADEAEMEARPLASGVVRVANRRVVRTAPNGPSAELPPPGGAASPNNPPAPLSLPAGEAAPVPSEALPALDPVPPIQLTPMSTLSTNTAAPAGELPRNLAAEALGDRTVSLGNPAEPISTAAPFYSTPRTPDFVHRPLYFEQKATERDGRSWGAAQPVVSGAQFFGGLAVLPYRMGAQPPPMRLNTGNGVVIPYDRLTARQKIRGILAEAGAVVGIAAILP
jgi:hypothetical protein